MLQYSANRPAAALFVSTIPSNSNSGPGSLDRYSKKNEPGRNANPSQQREESKGDKSSKTVQSLTQPSQRRTTDYIVEAVLTDRLLADQAKKLKDIFLVEERVSKLIKKMQLRDTKSQISDYKNQIGTIKVIGDVPRKKVDVA